GEQRVAVGHGITQPANISLSETADWLNRLESAYETLRVPGVNVNDPAVRAEIVATLDTLDVALDATAGMIARLGGAQNILSTLDNNHASVSLANKQAALILGQLDYADAAVKLNGYSAAVEATQKAYSRIS